MAETTDKKTPNPIEVYARAWQDFKDKGVLDKLNYVGRFVTLVKKIRASDGGEEIFQAGVRALVASGVEVVVGVQEKPVELPKQLLKYLTPNVNDDDIKKALENKNINGVKVRNETEAALVLEVMASGELFKENGEQIKGLAKEEARVFVEGINDVGRIYVNTATGLIDSAKAFGARIIGSDQQNG